MQLSTSEKIKILLKRKGVSVKWLAEQTNQTRQNLHNNLNRDNFSEKELKEIAKVLEAKYEGFFFLEDGDKL